MVLRSISHLDLSLHVVTVNKAQVTPELRSDPNRMYNYALQFPLLSHIKGARLSSVDLVVDQRAQKVIAGQWEMDDYLERRIFAEDGLTTFLKCSHVASHNSLGIQAVDVVANAIGRSYERGFARGRNIIARCIAYEKRLFDSAGT
jgi:hypothetical protein